MKINFNKIILLDGASVLTCALSTKVRSENPKNFEHWFCRRL